MFVIRELMVTIDTGISFNNPVEATADLSYATYFIIEITTTAILTLAAVLGLRRFENSQEANGVVDYGTNHYQKPDQPGNYGTSAVDMVGAGYSQTPHTF